MGTPEVVEKFDPSQLAEHQTNLDAAYRGLQKVFKLLTYEVGRLEDEPGLSYLGKPAADNLSRLAARLESVGADLKQFANAGGLEAMNVEEASTGPEGAD